MSWLKGMLENSSTSTSNGTYGVVGATTPSTLPYTSPTTNIVGPTPTTVPNGGYYSGSGGGNISTTTYPYVTTGTGGLQNNYGNNIHISGTNPTLATDKVKINLNELGELISVIKERLLIITPNFEKMEKYQALKKAYDHYKLLESMLGDEGDKK